MNPMGEAIFLVLLALLPLGHAWWCWSRGVYHARSVRVVRAERPIEFWFWMGTNLVLGGLMLATAAAIVLGRG